MTNEDKLGIQIAGYPDWDGFDNIVKALVKNLGAKIQNKTDSLDQRYWDLMLSEYIISIHLDAYMGISIMSDCNGSIGLLADITNAIKDVKIREL